MDIDFDKLLKVATKHMSKYVSDFLVTLFHTWEPERSRPTGIVGLDGKPLSTLDTTQSGDLLNADLWVFIFLSIFIGATLTAISDKNSEGKLGDIVVYVAVSWMGFATYVFLLSRYILRGSASFQSVARATLYSLATTYVIASFCYLLICIFAPLAIGESWVPPTALQLMSGKTVPVGDVELGGYLAAQGIILAILLGRNVRKLNEFRRWKSFAFVILAPIPILFINLLVAGGYVVLSVPFHK